MTPFGILKSLYFRVLIKKLHPVLRLKLPASHTPVKLAEENVQVSLLYLDFNPGNKLKSKAFCLLIPASIVGVILTPLDPFRDFFVDPIPLRIQCFRFVMPVCRFHISCYLLFSVDKFTLTI